jgi:hypothetical protein
MGKVKDITGMRFGNLIAIQDTKKSDAHRNRIWLCQCDCGNMCEVSGNNLRTGHTQSCGCRKQTVCAGIGKKQNIIDEISNVYGKLTVIALEKIENHCAFWKCKCECGNEIIVAGSHLRSGHTKSCGCLKSFGEEKINKILSNSNINYSTQYTIFINSSYMRFDYAIFDEQHNLLRLIEFDGEQHFNPTSNWYNKTHTNDVIKNQYCIDKKIPLIRIPYWEINNLNLDLLLSDKYKVH